MKKMEVFEDLQNIKSCPIEVALNIIGKKWSIQIIRDLFQGKKRFTDFLEANPQISTKMLSSRLKELQISGLIEKRVISATPVRIKYSLTQKGRDLNRVLFHLAEFSLRNYPSKVYNKKSKSIELDILNLKKFFEIDDSLLISDF
ncbi:MAG: winged helix-turn-helix transcriptional regulator [Candidatus Hodarchaeota archaeon]